MQDEIAKLEPCPWCQTRPAITGSEINDKVWILCANSDCLVRPEMQIGYPTEAEAVTFWNIYMVPKATGDQS